jgi:hypothetical protein
VNPFKPAGAQSEPFVNPFKNTESLFDMKPGNPFSTSKDWNNTGAAQYKVKEDSDDDQPLVANELSAMDRSKSEDSSKKFQAQIEKLKICKGVGAQCPAPCKKEIGYLSIEEASGAYHLVFRTLTGNALFNGILNKSAAKIKAVEKEKKQRLKLTVVVLDANKKIQVEHLEVTFLRQSDRDNFEKVYK